MRFGPSLRKLALVTLALIAHGAAGGSAALAQSPKEAARPAPLRIAVNVSPLQFTSEALQHAVAASIAETGIDAGQLEFEITESALHSDPGVVRGMRELKRLGVRIAIDDFGTGYSSLGSLKHLPIDTLKVDRLFIQGILDNVEDSVLLGTITGLAHTLGYQVVCEGIEQHEQALVLSGLGCDLGQGFLFSRPLPAAQIPSLLDGWVGAALVPSGRSIGRA